MFDIAELIAGREGGRYAAEVDRMMDDRVLATIVAKGGQRSREATDLDLAYEAIPIDPNPKPVRALTASRAA